MGQRGSWQGALKGAALGVVAMLAIFIPYTVIQLQRFPISEERVPGETVGILFGFGTAFIVGAAAFGAAVGVAIFRNRSGD